MIKILALSGSPVEGSSTGVLLQAVADSILQALLPEEATCELVHLAGRRSLPCEACGKAPTPEFCIHHDIDDLYDMLKEADCVLFGSPIHFDSVSAQAKLFIDRCNCFRPADFDHSDPNHDFIKLLPRKRPGGIVLVGGKEGWFEGGRRTIAGFFKWVEVVSYGHIFYRSTDFNRKGMVVNDRDKLQEAEELGRTLAAKIGEFRNV